MRLVVALVLRNLENRPINNESSNQLTCNMNYPGVCLGFFRIVVEPVIVSHRDNGMSAGSGLRRGKIMESVEQSIHLYTRRVLFQPSGGSGEAVSPQYGNSG